jgi:hypothetical protein
MRQRPALLKTTTQLTALALSALLLTGCGTPWATIADRTGEPVMLLGHDPLAYTSEGRAVPGVPEHTLSMFQRTYHFASAQNRYDFIADPALYEPQYGGFCAHGAAYGRKVAGDPVRWQIVEGRLFLFSSAAAQAAWNRNPPWHTEAADRFWRERQDMGSRLANLLALPRRGAYLQSLRD